MSKQIALLLLTTSILLTSFAAMVIPQANALNQSPNNGYNRDHVTARFLGDQKVCGNHLCAYGERTAWEKAVWDHQNISQGKITSPQQHGESVMHKLAGSTPGTTSGHGTPITGQ